MADIVVFGAGSIAEVAKVYIDAHGEDRIVGFTADRDYCTDETFAGLPLIPWDALESRFPPEKVKLLGPLSYQRMNDFRWERHMEGKARGYAFTSFIHPNCFIYATAIGENCFILENNIIQPFARVGDGVIIWSGSHIGHHASVGSHTFVSSQVGLGGGAIVGERCFLSGKSAVESGGRVGRACFLGTGVVVKDLPDEAVVLGRSDPPARYSSARLKRLKFR